MRYSKFILVFSLKRENIINAGKMRRRVKGDTKWTKA